MRSNIRGRTWLTASGPLWAVCGAVLLWALALPNVNLRDMDDFGLITILPVSYYAACAVLLVSFCLAVYRQANERILLLHIIALIIFIHGTPVILYGTMRYSWAWKHVGIVDYIQRHGSVDFNIDIMNAYHNWPGFFTLNALITEVAGFESPLSYALWTPVFFDLLFLGPLLLIFKACVRDQRLIWLSVWFFYLTNWVGQDYFSPQALGYFLHLVILGICLRWFSMTEAPSMATLKRWLVFERVASFAHHALSRAAQDTVPDTATTQPLQRAGLMTAIIVIFIVISSSHQLTPFMTISSVLALVILQRCSARSLPILLFILAMFWIAYVAVAFLYDIIESTIEAFAQLADNIDDNLIDLARASFGQQVIAKVGRGLSVFLWGLALLGGIRRLGQGYWDLSVIALAVAPFNMFAANSYGGEILFRIYFFSLPFMVFFAAALLYPSLTHGRSWRTAVMTVLISGVLLGGFFFPYYGKDRQYYFTENEVAAGQFLYDIAPRNALFIEGTRSYPTLFRDYEYHTHLALSRESEEAQSEFLEHPVETFTRWMSDTSRYPAAYVIITRSQKAEVDMIGDMPVGSLDQMEQTLLQSPAFEVIYENEDARIFTLSNATD